MSSKPLPRYVRKIDDLLDAFGEVPVEAIFASLYGEPTPPTRRLTAMRIGSALTRYRRLTGRRLVPGLEKYTYTILKD